MSLTEIDPLDLLDGMPHVIFWYTDKEGTILSSVGGSLRAIGLTRDAVVGNKVDVYGPETEELFSQAMQGMSGLQRTSGTWGPAVRHRYIQAWGPYYIGGGRPGGLVVVAMDITNLEMEAIDRIEETLSQAMPALSSLATAEAEAMRKTAEAALTKADASSATREALINAFRWLGTKIGVPLVILATALSMAVADQLGVLDAVLSWFGGPQ